MLLANASYIGKKGRSINGDYVNVLYMYKDRYIILDHENKIVVDFVDRVRLLDKDVVLFEDYTDRKLILNRISDTLKEELPYRAETTRRFSK